MKTKFHEPINKKAEPLKHKKYVGPDVPLAHGQVWFGENCYGFKNTEGTAIKKNKED